MLQLVGLLLHVKSRTTKSGRSKPIKTTRTLTKHLLAKKVLFSKTHYQNSFVYILRAECFCVEKLSRPKAVIYVRIPRFLFLLI